MEAIIFSNGDYENLSFYEAYVKVCNPALIICADGGANAAYKIGILPDLLIGDMDSVKPEILKEYQISGVEIKKYSTHKDETDTELAVNYCIEKEVSRVILFGALGSRLDHSFGNIYLLNCLLKKKILAEMVNESNRIFLVENSVEIDVEIGDTVSILSYTDRSEGIDLVGFEYSVENGVMEHYLPGYGISNVALEKHPVISVKEGILMVDIVSEKN